MSTTLVEFGLQLEYAQTSKLYNILLSCFKEFDCFPFDPASPTLRSLQFAIPSPPKLIHDFNTAKQDGESYLKAFMCVASILDFALLPKNLCWGRWEKLNPKV